MPRYGTVSHPTSHTMPERRLERARRAYDRVIETGSHAGYDLATGGLDVTVIQVRRHQHVYDRWAPPMAAIFCACGEEKPRGDC